MKRVLAVLAASLLASAGFAQTDSTTKNNQPDTIHVGNFIIIKKNKSEANDTYSKTDTSSDNNFHIHIGNNKYHTYKSSAISTNWLIFDLGFANYRDETDYSSPAANEYLQDPLGKGPVTKDDLKLKAIKSSNVNIWLFQQKLNVTKNVLNLKYGLGLEMYNFRYQSNISYHKSPAYIYHDSIMFSKNKLYAGYITVPFMVNINATPNKSHGFSISAGVSAGYLIGSRNKQVSDERGKVKVNGDFDLNKWRLAYVAELGLGPIRLYGSYSFNNMYEHNLTQYPYAVGIRLTSL